jgi:thiosulfate reductase cytochrome b subunit
MPSRRTKPQPIIIRITHWLNVPALVLMAMSGLQILTAYPHWGPRGAVFDIPIFDNVHWPELVRIGSGLAGARHIHFALAWLLVVNAIGYGIYVFASGEWRRRYFWPPRDTVPAVQQALHYLRLRKGAPPVNLYNSLQRFGYTAALLLAVLSVLSGLAIYKPVQLHALTWVLGGYDVARVIHFAAMIALGLFVVGHVVMVATHPRTMVEMVTGGKPGDDHAAS